MYPTTEIDTGIVASGVGPLARLAGDIADIEFDVRRLSRVAGACGNGALAGAVEDFTTRWAGELSRLAAVGEDLAMRLQVLTAAYNAAETRGTAMMTSAQSAVAPAGGRMRMQ